MFNFYPSLANYDMINGDLGGSMRMHWNQGLEHIKAWNMMNWVPMCNFGSIFPYTNPISNNWLLDPNFAAYSANQTSFGNSVFPSFNNNAGFNWNNPWGCSFGGSTATTSSTVKTTDDILLESNYNKLKAFVEQILADGGLTAKEEAELQVAKNDTSGELKDRYTKLKTAFDKINPEKIQKFIFEKANGIKLDGIELPILREEIGYEAQGTVDNEIASLKTAIDNLSESDENTNETSLIGHLKLDTYDILDVLSSYNSRYDEDLMKHIMTKEEFAKEEIDLLVNSLINKAESVKGNLDTASQKKMDRLIGKLSSANGSAKTEAFNNLYTHTRIAAAADLSIRLRNEYSDIADKVFTTDLFINKTVEDLKKEGFEVKADAVKVNEEIIEDEEETEPKTFEETVEEMVTDGVWTKTERICKAKGKELPIYEENNVTGDRKTKRLFVIDNGEVYEITQEEKDGQKVTKLVKTSTDSIADKEAFDEAKTIEEEKIAEETEATEIKEKAKADGKWLATALDGSTDTSTYTYVNEYLASLNKDNIMDFLTGYYIDGKEKNSIEGLIEKLDDEYDDGKILMDNKKKIISSLIAAAEDAGLQNSSNCRELKIFLKTYDKDTDRKTATTFNHGGMSRYWNGEMFKSSKGFWGACLGGIFDTVTDNEIIDDHIEALFEEIRAKQNN